MQSEADRARHAQVRGDIIRTLKEAYGGEMMMVRTLIRALDAQGFPLSQEDMEFHLAYLSDQGYIQIRRMRETPGYRRDRALPRGVRPDTIAFARLLPRGLQLMDGLIPEDPSVAF
jgi:DNA-binding transcriptional ArsR family regulator